VYQLCADALAARRLGPIDGLRGLEIDDHTLTASSIITVRSGYLNIRGPTMSSDVSIHRAEQLVMDLSTAPGKTGSEKRQDAGTWQ